jgi:hypothetical protein
MWIPETDASCSTLTDSNPFGNIPSQTDLLLLRHAPRAKSHIDHPIVLGEIVC